MPKLELELRHSTHPSSLTRTAESHHWWRAHKVSTCTYMYVCLSSTAERWSPTTFLNRERLQAAWLPCGSLSWNCTSLCRCYYPTGRWLTALKAEKHLVQLMCVWLAWTNASSTWTSYRLLDGQTWRSLGASLKNQCVLRLPHVCNLLQQTYICAAELATWDVGSDVCVLKRSSHY